jgi:serine/threonine-protein kinase
VYDSGETAGRFWFTMPYIEGENLRQRLTRERQLPVAEALRIAREAAEALDCAHRHGIIHRDIKPENILLSEGHALVADFGISRALTGSDSGERLTETGLVVGTPAYMSPEQAAGERSVDGRTDLYSLAVVLYELLAGEPPHTGPTAQAIIAKRFNQPVTPVRRHRPTVPAPVEQALQRALAPVPADRFSTAVEFSRALEPDTRSTAGGSPVRRAPVAVALGLGFVIGLGVLFGWLRSQRGGSTGTAVAKRVAVLPFQSVGDTGEQAFAIGISEEITTRLARVPGLSLVARSSALQYPRSGQTAPQFGRTLGVDYVLDGTVRSAVGAAGQKELRITPELIRVADGTHVWGEPYAGVSGDVFRLQADVAEQVAQALQGTLQGNQQRAIRVAPTRDLEAFRLYTLGRAEWNRRGAVNLERAADYFRQAIARDSTYARAWAGLADAYALYDYFGVRSLPRDTAYARGKRAALRAIALDSTLAEPHASLNQILRYGFWDWAGSEREIRKAIALDPNYATAHQWLSEHLLDMGRFTEAIVEGQTAVQLDPLAPSPHNFLALTFWYSGQIEPAIQSFRAAIGRDSTFRPALSNLLMLYLTSGRVGEAVELLESRHTPPMAAAVVRAVRDPAARPGVLAQLRKQVAQPPARRARVYLLLGEREAALAELEAAARSRDPHLESIGVDPMLATLRSDPRFARVLTSIGLAP